MTPPTPTPNQLPTVLGVGSLPPPLVDAIAEVLDTHHRIISQSLHQGCLCGWVGEVLGYDHAAHQARAVLAALKLSDK